MEPTEKELKAVIKVLTKHIEMLTETFLSVEAKKIYMDEFPTGVIEWMKEEGWRV